jgi:hypothetical protein
MSQYTKTIVVNSPPGSGGIFCRELIRNNLAADIVWPVHDLFGFQKDDVNICVIRNPYDSLASGIEAGFLDIPQHIRDFYMDDTDLMISDQLPLHLSNYYRFLDRAKDFDYITPVSFKFLTEQPEKFLQYISNKFQIPFKDNISAEEVKTQIANEKNSSTRVPREKTEFRKKIDDLVKNYEPIKHAHQEYLLLKDVLQSTENMI